MKNTTSTVLKHHYVRTFFASVFGVLALWLIILSVVVVWLNRTITDTNAYVSTVAPLVSKPAVKDFITQKIDDQINKNATPQDVASVLLSPQEMQGKTPAQLQVAVTGEVNKTLGTILSSPEFTALWRETNRSAHQQLITQIQTSSPVITLDFSKTVMGVVRLLKTTKLSPVTDKLNIDSTTAVVKLKGSNIVTVRKAYVRFQQGTILVILATLTLVTLSVIISVHHLKTLRRIALFTGIGLIVVGIVLTVVPHLTLGNIDPTTQSLVATIVTTLLRTLKMVTFSLGIFLIVIAIISKLYAIRKKPTIAPAQS